MGIFASDTTVTLDIPFDVPHTATIRKLSGWQLGKTQKAFFNELIAEVYDRGGAKVQKEIQQLFEKDPNEAATEIEAVKADPLNGHDRVTLIAYGLKATTSIPAWATMTPEARVDLIRDQFDDEAVEFFATEVLRLTKPALFLKKEEAKATQREAEAAPSLA